MPTPSTEQLTSIFEERAEYLDETELENWTSETPRDKRLLLKLTGPGAKLLSGPRGSGKSTLLRKAYFSLIRDGSALPAYVNFSRSLALEPLFLKNANAPQLFRQWVLYKIIEGIAEGIQKLNKTIPTEISELAKLGRLFIRRLETGTSTDLPQQLLAPSELLYLLESWQEGLGLSRCVLLLDDAAHAFSPEQQRDFFEIFRSLRSRYVAAKAAVYPGITSYSPFFHVGHEAEMIEAWYSPDDATYLQTMREVAKSRLPKSLYRLLEDRTEIIDYLALASFGLPRGFINMLSFVLGIDEGNEKVGKPTRVQAEAAVAAHAESVLGIFSSLKGKLPRYRRFVDLGIALEHAAAGSLRVYNRNKPPGRMKATAVGIAEPLSNEVSRILEMAEYAGMMRGEGSVSRGEKGVFARYTLHYALILTENSLSLGKSFPLSEAIMSLSATSAHAFVRAQDTSLLGADYKRRCTLDLAPCTKCGAARPSQAARFCVNCGNELKNTSLYDDLVKAPITRLPLTKKKLRSLRDNTSIRTVQDILVDEDSNEIRKAKYIGPVWTARIRTAAQEYVSV